MNYYLIFIFCFAAALSGGAQPLDDLLRQLPQANPALRAQQLQYRAAQERIRQTGVLPDPELGLGVFALPVETRLGPQWVRLSAGQQFPWPGTLQAEQDLALARAEPAALEAQVQERELALELKNAWLDWYQWQQEQQILKQHIRILESVEAYVLAGISGGKAGTADALRIQLEKQKLQQQKAMLEQREAAPVARINALLGRHPRDTLLLMDSLTFADWSLSVDSLGEKLRREYPTFELLESRGRIAEQSIRLNELRGKPTLGAGLDYILVGRRSDADPSGNGRDIIAPRLSLRLPLQRQTYEAREQEERIRQEAYLQQAADLENHLRAEFTQARSRLEEARLQQELVAQQRPLIQSIRSILETQYATQGSGFTDILEQERLLLEYELLELKAIVQSHRAKAVVEKYLNL